MPYTPPLHRSPASSASTSPHVSRRSSLQSGDRPPLPRSASYLKKHRRTTDSWTKHEKVTGAGPSRQAASETSPTVTFGACGTSDSVRQSPPPSTGDQIMPTGAILSPPESPRSGSDDESNGLELRGRKPKTLKDLRLAISQLPETKGASFLEIAADEAPTSPGLLSSSKSLSFSFSADALDDLPKIGRKTNHVRSATEPAVRAKNPGEESGTASDDETDEDFRKKPPMLRKKSGELVRPALRPSSRRRPSSMPGTPVFSKAVHFDSHLEHVRHFLQVDRPLAVSAGSSPVDNYESESEFPFPSSDPSSVQSPPFEWEITAPNFPHDTTSRNAYPVKLERVWLSPDQKSLLGSVSVANLAFQKHVSCRFTLDYWKTTSEIAAEYSHEIRPRETPIGHDRFTFAIKLSETANLESKVLFCCIRFCIDGQEFWDNNDTANFQVHFKKKYLPQNGKNNFTGAGSRPINGLPRSNGRRVPAAVPRPKSVPAVSSDGFGSSSARFNITQSLHDYLGESEPNGLRLKTKSSRNLASDNIASSLSSPSGAAFANRYDFGASLTAAVQAAKVSMAKDKDGLYMKSNVPSLPAPSGSSQSDLHVDGGAPASPGASSPNLSLPSSSYEELVNKYCFFGSGKSVSEAAPEFLDESKFNAHNFIASPTNMESRDGDRMIRHQSERPATRHFIPVHGAGLGCLKKPSSGAFASRTSSPLRNLPLVSDSSRTSTPKSVPASLTSTPPGYQPLAPSPHEAPYQQRMVPSRFPWRGDAHTATAIRG